MTAPARLPDAASLEAVLAGLDPASADADLVPALATAFPGFVFGLTPIDDDYWRDTRSVLQPDGTRLGELRPWMTAEIAKVGGDIKAVWSRLKETDLQITEWRGSSAFVSAPTGPGAADYIQIALGREIEWRAGPIINPDYRPWGESELLDPSWPRADQLPDSDRLAGPIYRLLGRAGGAVIHVRSFLDRCGRVEREKREAKRPELERRVIRESGPGGTRETPFLDAVPDYFDFVPRELRFFQDWEESSARPQRVFAHWALDARDYTHKGEREVGFIPRPLHPPKERLLLPCKVHTFDASQVVRTIRNLEQHAATSKLPMSPHRVVFNEYDSLDRNTRPLKEVVAYLDAEKVPVCANALYRRVTYRTMTSGHGTLYQMSDKDESIRKARYNADQVVRELLAASQGAGEDDSAA